MEHTHPLVTCSVRCGFLYLVGANVEMHLSLHKSRLVGIRSSLISGISIYLSTGVAVSHMVTFCVINLAFIWFKHN